MTFATRFCAPTPWTEVDGWFAPAFFFWWGTLFSQLFGCFFAWRVNKMVQMQDVRGDAAGFEGGVLAGVTWRVVSSGVSRSVGGAFGHFASC